VHLLPFLNIRIKLRDSLERQRIHQIDFVRFIKMLVLESFDYHGKRGREQEDLASRWEKGEDLVDYDLEFRRQEFIRFLMFISKEAHTSITKEVA
jgi:hypothetical protein